ncbi:MAG: C-terminal target protein [Bacteroidota bacterium]|jgi:gliding motility-associated-like protein|nr:C-terminal target protein [Bacteroidota bacterium]
MILLLQRTYNIIIRLSFLLFTGYVLLCNNVAYSQPTWVWGKDVHTASDEYANAVAIDPISGNAVIAGVYKSSLSSFYGSNFTGATMGAFVAKYDPEGNVIWGFKVGDNHDNTCTGIAIDSSGNIYVTGSFSLTTDFKGTLSTSTNLTATGSSDIFLAKYNSAGQLIWVRKAGGSSDDAGNAVAVNSSKVFITGHFSNSATFGSFSSHVNNSNDNVFIAAYDLSGSIQWMIDGASTQSSYGRSIAADNSGVYICGEFKGSPLSIYNPAGAIATSLTNPVTSKSDAYILSVSTSGYFYWSGSISSTEDDKANGVNLNGNKLFLTGSIRQNATFPFYASNPVTSGGNTDLYIASFSKSTGATQWVKSGSSSDQGVGNAITSDVFGNVYVAGYFKASIAFSGGATINNGGGNVEDIFVVSYSSTGSYRWYQEAGSNGKDMPYGIDCNSLNEVYVAGEYKKDPIFGPTQLFDDSGNNAFLAKIACPAILNNIANSSQTICQGSFAATINGTTPTGGTAPFTYSWEQSTDGLNWVTAGGTSNLQNYSPGAITSTTFYRRRVYSATSCYNTSVSNIITINVDQMPTTASAGQNQQVCSSAIPLTLNGNTPVVGTGMWTVVSGSASFANVNSPSSLVTAMGTGPNVLKWTISNGSCPSSSSTVSITVNALPVANAGPDQNICITSNSVVLNAGSPVNGNISWSTVSGTGSFSSTTASSVTVSNLAIGPNIFKLNISNGVCPVSSDMVTVVVSALPTVASTGADMVICASTPQVTLTGNLPLIGTGSWSVYNGSGIFSGSSSPSSSVSGYSLGVNTYLWTIANGVCPSSTANINIVVDAMPTAADAGTDKRVCISSPSVIMNATIPSVGTGTWSLVTGTGIPDSVSDAHTAISSLGSGENVFQWSVSNGVCPTSSSTVTITTDTQPDTASAGADIETDVPYVQLQANVPQIGTGRWIWLSGIGTMNDASDPSTVISSFPVGENVLRWEITNGVCPASSDDVHIKMNPLRVPNGFSPNGDGYNDTYAIEALEYYPGVRFKAFNKWGNIVYNSDEYHNEWDGTNLKNEKLPDDTYYFTLEVLPGMEYSGFVIIKSK